MKFQWIQMRLLHNIPTAEIAKTAGVHHATVYRWLERYEQGGFEALFDGDRTPKTSPNEYSRDVKDAIRALRTDGLRKEKRYLGPRVIAHRLQKYYGIVASPSGIGKFLHADGFIPEPRKRRRPKKERVRRCRIHDPGEKRICKMFVYANDVDDDAGPFAAVRFSHEGGRWRNLFPPRADDGWYPPDGGVEASPAHNDVLTCTGRAGTLVFCDTTMLHKGGFATKKERWMATLSYAAKNSFTHPVKYRKPECFEEKIKDLSEIQRFAVENV